MTHLSLVLRTPGPGLAADHLDIAEALEAGGWSGTHTMLTKDGARWALSNAFHDSTLTCPKGATVDFRYGTPTVVIVAACLAAVG